VETTPPETRKYNGLPGSRLIRFPCPGSSTIVPPMLMRKI